MGSPPYRVLGIDPGLTRLGFGVVQEASGRLECLRTGTLCTSPGPSPERLRSVFEGIQALIHEFRPDAVAVEKVFLKLNLKTGVPAIQAGGVALLAGALAGLKVFEYSPAQVKLSVSGTGAATKDQVQFMVARLLPSGPAPDTADAADALAVAITHIHSRSILELQAVQ
ncbi:MAG: crossover junction endodeoxyribonuclease RuvC [Actinomycetota bacterium]